MRLISCHNAWEDYQYWQSHDKRIVKKIDDLLKEIQKTPFEGMGNPLPLKFDYPGMWSRRIEKEHRLVYRIEGNDVLIYSCRFHHD